MFSPTTDEVQHENLKIVHSKNNNHNLTFHYNLIFALKTTPTFPYYWPCLEDSTFSPNIIQCIFFQMKRYKFPELPTLI